MLNHRMQAALFTFLLCTLAATTIAQEIIELPDPDTEGGVPLMQALRQHRPDREFSAKKLPLPVLSNLFWAAWGINRPDGHRTAPSARNIMKLGPDQRIALAQSVGFPKGQ